MKNKFLLGIFLQALTIPAFYSQEKKVKHDIKEVTVFLAGAQVTHAGNVTVTAGKNEFVFDDLSHSIDVNSIQAKGEGDFTILSVSHRINYLNPDFKTKEVKTMQDSLESMQMKLDMNRAIRGVYESEQSLLLENKKIGGANTGVSAAELEKTANLLRTRLIEIQMKIQELRIKEKKLNEQISKLSSQLNEMNAHKNRTSGEVIVTVNARQAASGKLSVSFLTPQAGWIPSYDIRAIDNSSPIKLDYRANVWQNSGSDWNDVKLLLSTGNPTISGTAPTLMPWWLTYYVAQYKNQPSSVNYGYMNSMPPSTVTMDGEGAINEEPAPPPVPSLTTSSFTQMNESAVNTVFDISIPYTIRSDSKKYSVEVQSFSIPAQYRYFCAPKMDRDAFLLAKITGWDKLNLLSGEANVFYEGMYVGKSYINTRSTSDTLSLSLGRDKNVVVTRIKVGELCEKKVIGNQKKETLVFEINVRNKKKQEIEIDIEDQYPLSSIKEIEIELLESSGAKVDPVSGKISWKYKMPGGDTKKMKFSFSVKFPKDKVLGNL
ncbi:MAG: DUF4139 domain-containing protein [Bacteroidia bacterium]|nr:DUF4139 domain-containing protein [Bacteroidia bacterium]